MSANIQISGPFIKTFWQSLYGVGRIDTNHPLYDEAYTSVVKAPLRRMNVIIQNNNDIAYPDAVTKHISISLSEGYSPTLVGCVLILRAGQTLTLDNYNGPIDIVDNCSEGGGAAQGVTIFESFA